MVKQEFMFNDVTYSKTVVSEGNCSQQLNCDCLQKYNRNQEKSNKVISTQNEMYALSYKLSAKSCEKLFHLKGCLA